MRFVQLTFLLTFLIVFSACIGSVSVFAADYKIESSEALQKEIQQNRKLFDIVVRDCLAEVLGDGKEYKSYSDTGPIEDCISAKGINLFKRQAPKVSRMGVGGYANTDVMVYEIPDKQTLTRRLSGQATPLPDNADRQAADNTGQPETKQPEVRQEATEKNTPSVQPKYYLPSKESDKGPSPIFLNR